MSSDWTEEIKKRLEAATPGPWRNEIRRCGASMQIYSDKKFIATAYEPKPIKLPTANYRTNAEFIANAPTDIKNLLEERFALRTHLEIIKNMAGVIKEIDDPGNGRAAAIEARAIAALAWEPKKS